MTRRLTPLLLVALLAAGADDALAQPEAYAIAGPAGVSGFFRAGTSWHAAGGGEFVLPSRIGVGGEVGILSSLIVLSLNGSVHLGRDTSRRVFPYLTGGYTRMSSGEGAFDAWNIGVGANYWTGRHTGVRFELRDHLRPDRRGTVQYWTLRAGLAVR